MDIEAERPMAFHSDLKGELMVRHFVGFEKLGECFEYAVTLYSKNADLDLKQLLGTHATVEVRMDLPEPRYFDGIVCEFSHLGREETYQMYRVILRPWLWLLSRARGCEIFQNLSVLDIARDMFGKGTGDKPATKKRAEERPAFALFDDGELIVPQLEKEYCVQYRESDLDFLSRLFEQAGIYFYFKHELGKHTLVLGDTILAALETREGFSQIEYGRLADPKRPEIGQILEWSSSKQVTVGTVALRDYDFEKPRADMKADKSHKLEHALSNAEIYDFPGCYTDPELGGRCALVKLEEAQAAHHVVRGTTNSRGLAAGSRFHLKGHTRKEEDREYFVVSMRYDLDAGSFQSGAAKASEITCHFSAIPSEVPFQPARRAPIPFVPGPQSAVVVGPKGKEVWTDNYGRVKVQLAWDRDGKYDENSSCYVRVSQAWAGAGWGAFHLPRIGQEVLVGFLDGDLDRPIVTGRVYNKENENPYDPQLHHSRSGFKTRTLGGKSTEFNELRFDDAKGAEEIVVRAQRDYRAKVLHDRQTSIGNDHKHIVKNNLAVTVNKGEYTTDVETDRMYIKVHQNEFHVVAQSITEDADKYIMLLSHDAKLTIEPGKMELVVGGASKITLTPAGIEINGPMVRINS